MKLTASSILPSPAEQIFFALYPTMLSIVLTALYQGQARAADRHKRRGGDAVACVFGDRFHSRADDAPFVGFSVSRPTISALSVRQAGCFP